MFLICATNFQQRGPTSIEVVIYFWSTVFHTDRRYGRLRCRASRMLSVDCTVFTCLRERCGNDSVGIKLNYRNASHVGLQCALSLI